MSREARECTRQGEPAQPRRPASPPQAPPRPGPNRAHPNRWRNTDREYGLVAVGLHWIGAALIPSLFALGLYMTSLDYYHPWYRSAPEWHKGLGVLLTAATVLRLGWRLLDPPPPPLTGRVWERRLAATVHWLLYVLILAAAASGYLISTADGRPLPVLGLFEIPSVTGPVKNLEDAAGRIHALLAWTILALVVLHVLGALKHHLRDRDATLRRMLGVRDESI